MNFLLPFLLLGGVPVAIFVYLAFIKKDKAQVVATEEIAVTVPAPAQADAKSDDEPKPVEVVVAVRLVKEVRGKILSTIATVMTILIWGLIYFGTIGKEQTFAQAIGSGFITNPFNLIGIAALVSGIGWWFDSPACMLLSGIALVAAVIFDLTAWFVLVPAVLFGFASERLVPKYSIRTKTKKI